MFTLIIMYLLFRWIGWLFIFPFFMFPFFLFPFHHHMPMGHRGMFGPRGPHHW